MAKTRLMWLIAFIIIAAGILFYINSNRESSPLAEVPDPGIENETPTEPREPVRGENIVVENLLPGDRVSSPLQISGEARLWYFEGEFGVRLEKKDGTLITRHFATAQGDWMTENFVPFISEVEFDVDEITEANLILHNNNPSDFRELDESVTVPIVLLPAGEVEGDTISLKIFLSDDSDNCESVQAVTREVQKTRAVAHAAINALFEGPTPSEQAQGLSSGIPENAKLKSIRIAGGVARADFSEELNSAAGSCLVTAIRAQIEETLLQFDTVSEVIISVEGEVETALQP